MTAARAGPTNRSLSGPLAFQIWLFTFVAFVGTTLLLAFPVLRAGTQVAYALPVIAWAILRVRGPMTALDVAIVVAIVAHLTVAATSLDPIVSLEASAAAVGFAVVFWLARHVHTRPRLRRVTTVAVVSAVMFWLVIIAVTWVVEKVADVQTFGWPPRLDAHQPYVWGSINTPPILALVVTPFLAWLPPGAFRRVTVGLWVVSALIIVPFSVGRAAWLGFAVTAVALEVLLGLPVTRRSWGLVRGRRSTRLAGIGLAAAAAVALVAIAAGLGGSIVQALDARIRLWQQALGLLAEDPLTGAGPGTFAWARLTQVPDFTDRVGAGFAHNVAFQTLADGGLLLAAAFAVVCIAWIALVVDRRDRLDRPRRVAVAVLIGYAAVATLDDLSFLPAVTTVLVIAAAWAIPPPGAPYAPRGRLAGPRGLVLPAALVITGLLATPGILAIDVARIESNQARTHALDGEWEESLAGYRRAASQQPSSALYWMSIGLGEARLGRPDAAREAYERARDLSPGDPRPFGALAALSGDQTEQIALLREAAARANDPQYSYRLATVLFTEGRRDEALDYLAIAVVLRPGLVAVVGPALRDDLRVALPDAIDRVGSIAGRNPNEALWNADLAAGTVSPDAPIQWAVVERAAAGDLSAARDLLDDAMAMAPRDFRTWLAADAVARYICNDAAHTHAMVTLDAAGGEGLEAGHAIVERPAGLYREPEIGDYQPLEGHSVPVRPQWPIGIVEVPDCGW